MDIIAATFTRATEAASAASLLASELHLERDLVTLEPLDDRIPGGREDGRVAVETVLVAWVREDQRVQARDLIGRHQGHHVPFDWAIRTNKRVAERTFLVHR